MAAPTKPVYLRLRDHIAAMILDGSIAEGGALPSVRALAAEQGANPLTVAKAYQGFQEEGLVRVRRGVGLFVEPGAPARLRADARARFLAEEWPAVVRRIRQLGLDPAELVAREEA